LKDPPEIRKFENPGFRPARDVLEIGPEWRRLCRHGGWDAEAETGPEAGNLATWGGESGPGLEAVGATGQIFSLRIFGY
jgi:hypothetical protein